MSNVPLLLSVIFFFVSNNAFAALPPTTGPWTASMSVSDVSFVNVKMYLYPTTSTLIQSPHTWFTISPVAGTASPVLYTIRHSTGYYLSGDFDNGMFSLDSTSNKNWFIITWIPDANAPPNIGVYKIQNVYRSTVSCSSASYLAVTQLGYLQNADLRYSSSPEPNGWYLPDPLPTALYYNAPKGAYSLPSNFDAFTVTAVVTPNAAATGRIWDRITVGAGDGWLLDLNPALTLRIIASTNIFYAGTIPASVKTHVALLYSTWDGKVSLYVNGILVFTTPTAVDTPQNQNLNLRLAAIVLVETYFRGLCKEDVCTHVPSQPSKSIKILLSHVLN